MGFTLAPSERDALVARDPRNAERIFPYLGGEELNASPTQSFERYVINFASRTLEEAERWPDLVAIVRAKVKPERDKNNRETYRRNWWHYGEKRPALYAALAPLARCLVISRHSKHLLFAFQPPGQVFSEATNVFALDCFTAFAILQSRIHEPWARLLSSSLEDRLRYSVADCFEPFPFPTPDPRTVLPALEAVGEKLYQARAAYMALHQVGLTETYNRLKEAACTEPAIEALRALHVELDRAVLDAYGFRDLAVPAFATPRTPEEEQAQAAFADEVIDRLFVLNAARAEDERLRGAAGGKKKGGPRRSKKPRADTATRDWIDD
jgi:hypothetical protein